MREETSDTSAEMSGAGGRKTLQDFQLLLVYQKVPDRWQYRINTLKINDPGGLTLCNSNYC
jgi:hypothetical protein